MNCKVCDNTSSKNPNVSFFRFPSENARCREWAERCNILDLYEKIGTLQFYKSCRICSDHFDPKYIVFDGRKKRLLYCAVPQIFNINKNSDTRVQNTSIIKEVENDYDATFKLKLVENLCRLCAEENRNLTDIYGWRGRKMELENKLKHLPIEISENDVLPLRLCNQCIVKINNFHEFITNCIKSETKLKIMLDLEGCDTTYKKVDNIIEDENIIEERQTTGEEFNVDNDTEMANTSENNVPKTIYLFPENQILNYDTFLEEIQLNDLSSQDIPIDSEIDSNNFSSTQNQETNQVQDTSEKNQTVNIVIKKLNLNNIIKQVDFRGHFSLEHDYSNLLLKQDVPVQALNENESSVNKFIDKTKYSCYICLKSFSSLEILNSHAKAHLLTPNENGKFVCKSCDKVFGNRYRLNEHIRIHTGECPYKCDACDKKFHKIALLKQHSLIHNPDKPYLCSICNVRSSRRGNLIQHMKSHYKNTKLQNLRKKSNLHACKICLYFFPSSEELKIHEKADHFEKNQKPASASKKFMCDLCSQSFASAEECQIHTQNHIFTSFTCGICRKDYSTIDSLKHHFKSHNVDMKFICQYCDKIFKSKEVCVIHERGHTGEAPFECSECGKTFRSRQSFHQHKSIHSEKRLFSCEECNMSFKRKDTLKNHFRIHTGERPFACKICGFAFKQRGDCIKHEKNHKKKKEDIDVREKEDFQLECSLCSDKFDKAEDLKQHLATIHNHSLSEEESPWVDGDNFINLQSYSAITEENLAVENLPGPSDNSQAILALAL